MSPWRLEAIRLWRTRQLLILLAAYLLLGLGLPILTYYLPTLIKNAGNGVHIIAPKPTPTDSIKAFGSNAGQLGTLVVVIVAAVNLSLDAHPGVAAFYRSRVRRPSALILYRYAMVNAASIAALVLGTACAWYETRVLLGSLPAGAVAVGLLFGALWICVATSTVALFASVIRGVSGVVGATIALFLGLALLEGLPAVHSWFPTSLANAAGALVHNALGDLWHAVVAGVVCTLGSLRLALMLFGRREVSSSGARHD
jgi:ABC-2 type transport system permease protein